MKAQLVFLALVGLTAGLDFKPLLDLCSNPPPATRTLPQSKMILPENYKISGSVTNMFAMQTWLLKETATKDFRVLERQTKEFQETWIQDLSRAHPLMFVNTSSLSGGGCNGNATKPDIIGTERFKIVLGSDTSSINSMANALLKYTTDVKGFLVENHIDLVGGVNANTRPYRSGRTQYREDANWEDANREDANREDSKPRRALAKSACPGCNSTRSSTTMLK